MSAIVAIDATRSSAIVAKRETAVAESERYHAPMDAWVTEALRFSGIGQAELARRLTAALGRSIDRAAVNKMTKGTRNVDADEMLAIAEITKFPAPRPAIESAEDAGTVRLVGYVGAGSAMNLFAEGQDLGERVRAPEGATKSTVAVEIRGESLGELFDRWLVYYDDVRDPPDTSMIGRLCVCGLPDGRVLIKKMKRGQLENTWTLVSNGFEPPIHDVTVEWAARVKQMSPR